MLKEFIDDLGADGHISFESVGSEETQERLRKLVRVAKSLSKKYDVVVTNPPYAGAKGLNQKLTNYLILNYTEEKGDLFASFVKKTNDFVDKRGYVGLITPTAWLYNPSFTLMREKQLSTMEISSLVELGSNAFDVGFGTTMFVFMKKRILHNYIGTYYDIKDVVSNDLETLCISNSTRYTVKMDYFSDYEGNKFSYKLTEPYRKIILETPVLSEFGSARAGLQTDDNARFIREWYEVELWKTAFHHKKGDAFQDEKWFPHIKGGTYRKWYGNLSSVVNWQYDGSEIKENAARKYGSYTKRVQSMEFYFQEGIAWTHTTYSQPFACRYVPEGIISNVEGPEIFNLGENQFNVLGMLNSKVMDDIFMRMSDSIHYLAGDLSKFPIRLADKSKVDIVVKNNICISKNEWDSFEVSWDFQHHPLLCKAPAIDIYAVKGKAKKIEDRFKEWEKECDDRFNQLRVNEEQLNRIFIDIYGLQDELTPEVEDKDVTVRKADLQRDIKSFLSYAVGCMFGRYSLDRDGLVFAGGDFEDVFQKKDVFLADGDGSVLVNSDGVALATGEKYYGKIKQEDGSWTDTTFYPDMDNCIPITDEEYFSDDIVGRFVEFVKIVYGADTLEENLDFIAKALGNKGNTSREIIRNYFLKDFYADHLKVYQKRPIYWLFDSGKENGFKALIYMHRYNADTVGRVRTDYLHRAQKHVETAMQSAQYTIENAASPSEKSKATKAVTKYTKQLAEMKIYDEAIAHIANKRIEIDLDDGVKVNYAKFQGVEVAQEGKKALKVDLLAKLK